MRYEIKQKILAFGDDFGIRDESGREKFYVDGKALSLGKKLAFLDEQKREVAFISQKVFSFTPTFNIKRNGRIVATIKKRWLSFRPRFLLDVPGPHDYEVVGDFVGHEYTIMTNSRPIARVSKRFFAMSDSYGVEVSDGDHVLVLSAAIIIDLVLHNRRKR